MKHKLTRLIAALDRLVNYFTLRDHGRPGSYQGAHVFLISHILGPFISNVVRGRSTFLIQIGIRRCHPGDFDRFLDISLPATGQRPYYPLALVSVQNLIFCILWSATFTAA
jgi:hypothetical protein